MLDEGCLSNQVGDLLAYQLVESTASWTLELSNYRVSFILFT